MTNHLMNNADTPNGWRRITPVLQGWLFAVRKPYPNGSHVAVFVACVSGLYEVVVETEHGTLFPEVRKAGSVGSLPEAMQLVQKTCSRYDDGYKEMELSPDTEIKKWFYATEAGIKGPVEREQLFELLESNAIGWDTQVMVECKGISSLGQWDPLVKVLGIPMPFVNNTPSASEADWFGWIGRFFAGAFVGIFCSFCGLTVWLTHVELRGLLHSYAGLLVLGCGLMLGAIATQVYPNFCTTQWMYPRTQLQQDQTMKQTTLGIGIAGLATAIFAGFRLWTAGN